MYFFPSYFEPSALYYLQFGDRLLLDMMFQTKSRSCLPKTLRSPYNLHIVIVDFYNVDLLHAYLGNVKVGVRVCDLHIHHMECPSL